MSLEQELDQRVKGVRTIGKKMRMNVTAIVLNFFWGGLCILMVNKRKRDTTNLHNTIKIVDRRIELAGMSKYNML